MLHGVEQAGVLEGLARARLQRVHQHRVLHVAHRHRQPLEKGQRLVAERGLLDADSARADEVLQQLVEQDQAGAALEQLHEGIGAGGDARLVLRPDEVVAFPPAERPCDPAPQGPCGEVFLLRRALAARHIEELAVGHRDAYPTGTRQAGRFRQSIERRSRPGGVQQRGKGVRLAAAERGEQLEHSVALPAGEAPEHVFEQGPEPAREV